MHQPFLLHSLSSEAEAPGVHQVAGPTRPRQHLQPPGQHSQQVGGAVPPPQRAPGHAGHVQAEAEGRGPGEVEDGDDVLAGGQRRRARAVSCLVGGAVWADGEGGVRGGREAAQDRGRVERC